MSGRATIGNYRVGLPGEDWPHCNAVSLRQYGFAGKMIPDVMRRLRSSWPWPVSLVDYRHESKRLTLLSGLVYEAAPPLRGAVRSVLHRAGVPAPEMHVASMLHPEQLARLACDQWKNPRLDEWESVAVNALIANVLHPAHYLYDALVHDVDPPPATLAVYTLAGSGVAQITQHAVATNAAVVDRLQGVDPEPIMFRGGDTQWILP